MSLYALQFYEVFKSEKVKLHIYRNGFKNRYCVWTDHDEIDGVNGIFYNLPVGESSRSSYENGVQHDRVHELVSYAFRYTTGWNANSVLRKLPMKK